MEKIDEKRKADTNNPCIRSDEPQKPRQKYLKYKIDPNGIVYDIEEVVHNS